MISLHEVLERGLFAAVDFSFCNEKRRRSIFTRVRTVGVQVKDCVVVDNLFGLRQTVDNRKALDDRQCGALNGSRKSKVDSPFADGQLVIRAEICIGNPCEERGKKRET